MPKLSVIEGGWWNTSIDKVMNGIQLFYLGEQENLIEPIEGWHLDLLNDSHKRTLIYSPLTLLLKP